MSTGTPTRQERGVNIQKDATGNIIITGEGNMVVFQTLYQQDISPTVTPIAMDHNPYKGLDAFTEQDSIETSRSKGGLLQQPRPLEQ